MNESKTAFNVAFSKFSTFYSDKVENLEQDGIQDSGNPENTP